jgi:hypothetical protein
MQNDPPTVRTTLLELVAPLSGLTESEEQTVRMAREPLASGKVELTGSFKDCCHKMLF